VYAYKNQQINIKKQMDKTIQSIVAQWSNVISEHRDWSNLISAIVICIIGVIVLVISALTNLVTGNLAICTFVGGAVLMCIGFWLAMSHGSELRYTPTNSKITVKQKYINRSEWAKYAKAVNGEEPHFDGDGQLLLNTLSSADGKFSVCMVSQFIDFDYKVIYGPCEVKR